METPTFIIPFTKGIVKLAEITIMLRGILQQLVLFGSWFYSGDYHKVWGTMIWNGLTFWRNILHRISFTRNLMNHCAWNKDFIKMSCKHYERALKFILNYRVDWYIANLHGDVNSSVSSDYQHLLHSSTLSKTRYLNVTNKYIGFEEKCKNNCIPWLLSGILFGL